MTEVVERGEHHVRLEDESGERRFVLTRCPACGQRLVGADCHGVDDVDVLHARAAPVAEHLAAHHGPECFGLGELAREHQGRLSTFGGEPA